MIVCVKIAVRTGKEFVISFKSISTPSYISHFLYKLGFYFYPNPDSVLKKKLMAIFFYGVLKFSNGIYFKYLLKCRSAAGISLL